LRSGETPNFCEQSRSSHSSLTFDAVCFASSEVVAAARAREMVEPVFPEVRPPRRSGSSAASPERAMGVPARDKAGWLCPRVPDGWLLDFCRAVNGMLLAFAFAIVPYKAKLAHERARGSAARRTGVHRRRGHGVPGSLHRAALSRQQLSPSVLGARLAIRSAQPDCPGAPQATRRCRIP
jgi:hypothetical protein